MAFIARLRTLIPSRQQIVSNRWLGWLGPHLYRARLWRMSRRGIARGIAIGIFFGLLIPIAQIPFSAGAAVILRAHLPSAVASTLVTNPVTFGPIYYGAYQLGLAMTGDADNSGVAPNPNARPPANAAESKSFLQGLQDAGKPLIVGLLTLAVTLSLATYLLTDLIIKLVVTLRRRQRRRQAQRASGRRAASSGGKPASDS